MVQEAKMDKIGEAVRTIRKRYHLRMEQVYSGLVSQTVYHRLENGVREIKPHILEVILSRLGIKCRDVDMIISKEDFEIYCAGEEYREYMEEENYTIAEQIQKDFVEKYASKDTVLRQKGYVMEGELAYIRDKDLHKALKCYRQALNCTVSLEIQEGKRVQLFSKEELKLSIKIAEIYMEMGDNETAEQYLWEVNRYMNLLPKKTDKANEEGKINCYLARFLFDREEYRRVLYYTEKGIALLAEMNGFTIQGDLFFYHAHALEKIYQNSTEWKEKKIEAFHNFRTAYYVYEFLKKKQQCDEIRKHMEEVYEWQNI